MGKDMYEYRSLSEAGPFNIENIKVQETEMKNGDYTTPVSLSYIHKNLADSPHDFATKLVNIIAGKKYPEIGKIEVAGPGFINITLTKEAIRAELESTEKVKTKYSGKKVLVEHSSPNLFKPFHIGHLMNNIIGEFVVRAMRAGSREVGVTSFPSDVSLGIAKAIYIVEKDGRVKIDSNLSMDEISYLGEAYTRGVAEYEANVDIQERVKNIANQIYKGEHPLYEICKKINIEYFIETTKNLGSEFDSFIYESEAGVRGLEIIKENIPSVFIESEGAVVYVPDELRKDINTTVFINSQGNPTYAAKDIGLIDKKFEYFNPDVSIYITDNEQIPHFKTVFAAGEEMGETWKDRISKSLHVPHGRMTFKGHKMSSRLGGVPLAEDTIEAVLEEVRARSGEHIAHFAKDEQDKIQRDIALSALRVAILRAKPGSNINFDPETSLSFEGDSGPYLLYTHARCASLLSKGIELGISPKKSENEELTTVERKLIHYKEVLADVIENIAPQKLVTYLFELAQEFNSFYNDILIVVGGDIKGTEHRLYIVGETKKVLLEALGILGINAPERM